MCRLRNIAMRDFQESVTTGQTHGRTDAGQSDPYVPLCFAGDTKTTRLLSTCWSLFAIPRKSQVSSVHFGLFMKFLESNKTYQCILAFYLHRLKITRPLSTRYSLKQHKTHRCIFVFYLQRLKVT